MAKAQVFHAVGKRKSAIARVFMKSGNGQIVINERPADEYFPLFFRSSLARPFTVLEQAQKPVKKLDVSVNVHGGGTAAQAEACMYGISKALSLMDSDYRPPLKKARLITRDSRVVERKKYGHKKARKSFQFSKR